MLRAEGVTVSIAGAAVLRSASFRVAPGERVALIGPNGAGKTTTLRALMGLLPLDAERITLDGADAGPVPAHGRARMGIGYAPEERRLFGPYTVEENLRLPAEVLGLPRPRRRGGSPPSTPSCPSWRRWARAAPPASAAARARWRPSAAP